MNGFHENCEAGNKKPIVTYDGEKELFEGLSSALATALAAEPADWSRSYGRATKSVKVSSRFVPFSASDLATIDSLPLIDRPLLHTYWTQCPDVEAYKSPGGARENIEAWMKTLTQHNIQDWMIVVVETYDLRRANKLLPRTTVLDKIRTDFAPKHADRCLSVINPLRGEWRSAGSWRGLVVNMRLLLLAALDRGLSRAEEAVRALRERRNHPRWTFTSYFLLQEELAFVLEMLGVHEEALVQYDELDALFTQFILNSNLGECPAWMAGFRRSIDAWEGPSVNNSRWMTAARVRVQEGSASLLQFRNYLFARQAALLLAASKPAEVAGRTLGLVQNCLRELVLLEVTAPAGALAAWAVLCCLEVLDLCSSFSDPASVDQTSVHTASLCDYASIKLGELGEICGLMPGATGEPKLHAVVEITMGLGEENSKPVEQLKAALSSRDAFAKQYLELSEVAMSRYKHMGRGRWSREVGRRLAARSSAAAAAPLLADCLAGYERDAWPLLSAHTRLSLAEVYAALPDYPRYVKMCAAVACSAELDMSIRQKHFDEMVSLLSDSNKDLTASGWMGECMRLDSVEVTAEHGGAIATVSLTSLFPAPVRCSSSAIALSRIENPRPHKESRRSKEDMNCNPLLQRLPVSGRLDYQQDRSLAMANVDVRNQKQLLRRQDSHGRFRKVSTVSKGDFTMSLAAKDITLTPGKNSLNLTIEEVKPGSYKLGQFSISILGKLELLSQQLPHKVQLDVEKSWPVLELDTGGRETLIAGINESVILKISTLGKCLIPQGSCITVESTAGLGVSLDLGEEALGSGPDPSGSDNIELTLKETVDGPASSAEIPLSLLAQLPVQAGPLIHHTLKVKGLWGEGESRSVNVSLAAALQTDLRVYTAAGGDKWLHVTVAAGGPPLRLRTALLSTRPPTAANLQPANPPSSDTVLSEDCKGLYMWQLKGAATGPLQLELALEYEPLSGAAQAHLYKCLFDLVNHETEYELEGRVEPCRGAEFCRVSTVCRLHVRVTRVAQAPSPDSAAEDIMYEVAADTARWAVCGPNTGVLSLCGQKEASVDVDVMPLVNGFLPLPTVKLSRYYAASSPGPGGRLEHGARLEQFYPGQVYYVSKGYQTHVIAGGPG